MSVVFSEKITSRKNPAVVRAAKLSLRKEREESGTFAIEGIKLFEEAVAARAEITEIFVTEAAAKKYENAINAANCGRIYSVTEQVYEKLTQESAPQGICAVLKFFNAPKSSAFENPYALILDGVSDPGNLGTIIRCADAFGAECVYIGDDGADIYNPKTVRASMGSLFRVRTERVSAAYAVARLRADGYTVYASTLNIGAKDVRAVNLSERVALVIGNEGRGISNAVSQMCDGAVILPMAGGAQSLNAASAASVLMWEAAKARMPNYPNKISH